MIFYPGIHPFIALQGKARHTAAGAYFPFGQVQHTQRAAGGNTSTHAPRVLTALCHTHATETIGRQRPSEYPSGGCKLPTPAPLQGTLTQASKRGRLCRVARHLPAYLPTSLGPKKSAAVNPSKNPPKTVCSVKQSIIISCAYLVTSAADGP